jgi:hypothetical protein
MGDETQGAVALETMGVLEENQVTTSVAVKSLQSVLGEEAANANVAVADHAAVAVVEGAQAKQTSGVDEQMFGGHLIEKSDFVEPGIGFSILQTKSE